LVFFFFFSSRRRHTRCYRDWSSDVCSSDLGCNSVVATKLALALCDVVLSEAGFGADLGAEKFFDIKCRAAGLNPEAAIVVASVQIGRASCRERVWVGVGGCVVGKIQWEQRA